jgi:hypothetical protein
MSTCLFGIQASDASLDFDPSIPVMSDEHSADFGGGRGTSMLPDLSYDFAINR